jgi:hypothetical protein
MTKEQLIAKLIEHSPFQMKGSKETTSFTEDTILIDGEPYFKYHIEDGDNGFKIITKGLMPFHDNFIIWIEKELGNEFPVIVNYTGEKLLDNPDKVRHAAAEGGFFILESIK